MEHECWQNAMQVELQALEKNHTWDIVPCPSTIKPIGTKWVFSIKLCSDGSLDWYKAHLVALGNKQEYGEEIYMKLPSVMINSSPHDVCKLKRSLYGLKQAPWAWFEKFCSTILSFSFTQSHYDSSLFFHTSVLGIVLLLVYVDDIIITGTKCGLITKLQRMLHTTFHMKELGHLTYFLGLEYIQDLITLAGLEDTSSVDTPMEFDASSAIFEVHLLVGYSFLPAPLFNLLPMVMLIGLGVEYHAMSTACSEIIWLRGLLKELGFPRTTSTLPHLDNTSAIDCHQSYFS
ncbi:hypothetical protein AAG906_039371 [Vitis piasezkii]